MAIWRKEVNIYSYIYFLESSLGYKLLHACKFLSESQSQAYLRYVQSMPLFWVSYIRFRDLFDAPLKVFILQSWARSILTKSFYT